MKAWDEYDAYLFDIDGTLLHCRDAVHYFAFCDALTAIAGRPLNLDGVVTQGNVDLGILRDAFHLAGMAPALWRPQVPAITAAMGRFVEARRQDFAIEVLPAVPEVLTHLHGRGARVGVATGNFAAIGRAKLQRCGLWPFFHFAGFSDTFEYRGDVIAAALAQALSLTSPSASTCVVGDTPEDIRAARANRLDVIAVASGIYTPAELQAESPTLLLHSLLDLKP